MNFIVAVSGGVDSVVLLDLMVEKLSPQSAQSAEGTRQQPSFSGRVETRNSFPNLDGGQRPPQIIVAHVDHGIREDSAADARFVAELARQYGLSCESKRFELGAGASEDAARQVRYEYLRELAHQYDAAIVTAHHQDDIIGSIAINLHRGTGWRGLAVMNTTGVIRPLLGWTKAQIYDYARDHLLEWVEDSTNRSDRYVRNRLRGLIHQQIPDETQRELARLRRQQLQLADSIDTAADQLVAEYGKNRYFYTMIDIKVATELLRHEVVASGGRRPTATQAERAVLAIRGARAGTRHDIGDGTRLELSTREFVVVFSL